MPQKLLIITSEDWYFLSHRLPVGRAADEMGMETVVATGVGSQSETIWSHGYRHISLQVLNRGRGRILSRVRGMRTLGMLLRRERPTIVYAVSLRYAILSVLASRLFYPTRIAVLMPGLGFVFSSEQIFAVCLRPFVSLAMRFLFNSRRVQIVLQNQDNFSFFRRRMKVPAGRLHLIRGSGVNMQDYKVEPIPAGRPVVVLAGRMLWSKGVQHFVDAARLLEERNVGVRMALVGVPDAANPDHVSTDLLSSWRKQKVVEWWGFQDNMAKVWSNATLAVFPTWYGEGIPKAMLEAAACGRAVIASDVPGCRDVIIDGENGLLIPPRETQPLADAIERLIADPVQRVRLANNLHNSMRGRFDDETVTIETRRLFSTLLGDENGDGTDCGR